MQVALPKCHHINPPPTAWCYDVNTKRGGSYLPGLRPPKLKTQLVTVCNFHQLTRLASLDNTEKFNEVSICHANRAKSELL